MVGSIDGLVEALADEVSSRLRAGRAEAGPSVVAVPVGAVPVGISARHVHLSRSDADALFGEGHRLTRSKDLSQPGQYACEERVTVVSRSGKALEGLRVLGPERGRTQVELSASDARALGVAAP
ncbi:MAG: hypothetical protein KKA67_07445, partial [Spirochaetes bacterium]|nr:hypothetical protein [Spirochaetota bacterium]